ncbi:G2/mitotic-specific cyclin-3 [Plectosphaerella plurivora]|uniref:G2/mitotic-specific cyclin-3 n=1 Tax=Plectosphaerella plurivora TaxID=936078 RepID=A0A9P8VBC0_9PEZI|nr:G2/mitotic-specific cyclin-3 [Plectosphaerella plurivora]
MPVAKNEALHQRNKSNGNLQTASRVGGLQAAAKRTVFGDVSNVVKNLTNGANALGKGKGDAATKAATSQPPQGFSKPAQRSVPASTRVEPEPILYTNSNAGAKLNVHSDLLPDLQGYSAGPASYLDLPPQQDLADMLYPISQYVSRDAPPGLPIGVVAPSDLMIKSAADSLATASISALSLGPRHHKSQPALKKSAEAQAQALRRTQSKQFSGQTLAPIEPCKYLDDLTEASYEDALEHLLDDQLTGPVDIRDMVGPAGVLEKPESVDSDSAAEHGLALVGAVAALPGFDQQIVYGEPARSPATVALDEYWDELDEEEEVYDDQGYTTAHSYRSRGELTSGGPTAIMAPTYNEAEERELEVARLYVDANRTPEDIEDDIWDVCMVAEYGEEIFEYMRELEAKLTPDAHYMDHQTEVQWSMRSVLMDWLVQVHMRFNLLPETLFLTINYIDRFLTFKAVSIGKLQLVGATALLIAAKYEEINCPSLEEIVFMVDGSYSVEEILKAERFMLSMLGFELGWPGPMSFLRRISKADEYDLETRTLAKYFLEVTIMDERFVACPPSFLAAGAHCLSRLMLKKGDWSLAHVHYSGYTWSQVRPLVMMLLDCCYNAQKHHAAVFEKYSDKRYKKASSYVQGEIEKGFLVPGRSPASSAHHTLDMIDFDNTGMSAPHQNAMVPLEMRG